MLSRKVSLIFFPPICYIEFSSALPRFPMPTTMQNSVGKINAPILFSYFPKIFRDCGLFRGRKSEIERKAKVK